MMLSELEPETQINIQFIINNKRFSFPVTILGNAKGFVLTDPVVVEGKILNFTQKDIAVELLYDRKDERPIVWRRVNITTIHSKKGAKYCIKDVFGKEINRRANFRAYVGINGLCKLEYGDASEQITVRDISTSGFSFTTKRDSGLSNNQVCYVDFEDKPLGYSLKIGGTVERVQTLDNGIFVYGCKLIKPYTGLDEYVNIKQREQLAKSSSMVKKFNYDKYRHLRISIK